MIMRPLPFSLRQIQYVLALAETRNFHRAAEQCAVVQPSLSAQVAALEAALGTRLFERGKGGVQLTPAGEAFLARARRLMREAEDLAGDLARFKDPFAGQVRLGIIPTLGPYLLPALAPAIRKAFPRLVPLWTEDRTATLVRAIHEGRMEGAILALEADLEGLETHVLGQDPFALVLPRGHRLAKGRGPVALEALQGERVLLLDDGHCLRTQALAVCAAARAEELGFRATSLPTLVQMVASGAGITLLPRSALATETARATVTVREFKAPAPFRTLALAWRKDGHRTGLMARLGKALEGSCEGR
jgi:LysR family transcriptional regulator, hydrogen peroxide-inducible genes activator